MLKTVFVFRLANGLKLCWTVAEMGQKVPVIETDGRYYAVNSKTDDLKLLDVLDAIMAEKRANTYPHEGVTDTTLGIERREVDIGEQWARWKCVQWSDIAFSDLDLDLDHYQRCIDDVRRALA